MKKLNAGALFALVTALVCVTPLWADDSSNTKSSNGDKKEHKENLKSGTSDQSQQEQRVSDIRLSEQEANRQVTDVNKASKLIGLAVHNKQDEKIGKIDDLVIDFQSGRVAYAVLGVGGVLGIGDKLIAVPLHSLTLVRGEKYAMVDLPKEEVKRAAGFAKNNWPDLDAMRSGTTVGLSHRQTDLDTNKSDRVYTRSRTQGDQSENVSDRSEQSDKVDQAEKNKEQKQQQDQQQLDQQKQDQQQSQEHKQDQDQSQSQAAQNTSDTGSTSAAATSGSSSTTSSATTSDQSASQTRAQQQSAGGVITDISAIAADSASGMEGKQVNLDQAKVGPLFGKKAFAIQGASGDDQVIVVSQDALQNVKQGDTVKIEGTLKKVPSDPQSAGIENAAVEKLKGKKVYIHATQVNAQK